MSIVGGEGSLKPIERRAHIEQGDLDLMCALDFLRIYKIEMSEKKWK